MEKKYKLSTVQKMKFSLRISSVFVWCSIKTYKIPTKLYTKESAYFRQCFFFPIFPFDPPKNIRKPKFF